jgi:hypothetical protein
VRAYLGASNQNRSKQEISESALGDDVRLSDLCYLTDGGHFDNTGLYSLIERGCRFIVLADCGADPTLAFADLSEAIRRCRIDFGAQIQLHLAPLTQERPQLHCVRGRIQHSTKHAESLGWSEEESRRGELLVIKPVLAADTTVDLQNYKPQNDAFPQQSTADQFFDEAQFESYRALGELSAATSSAAILQMMDSGVDSPSPPGP